MTDDREKPPTTLLVPTEDWVPFKPGDPSEFLDNPAPAYATEDADAAAQTASP